MNGTFVVFLSICTYCPNSTLRVLIRPVIFRTATRVH